MSAALVVLASALLLGLANPALAGGGSRVVVIAPTPGGADIPIGPNEKIGAVTVVTVGGVQVAVVRIDPMPEKPDFNIITPEGVSHPFTNGPTGVPGETVRWVSQPIHHPDGSTSYEVHGEFSGPGYSGKGAKEVFPPGSVAVPDPPQPLGLMVWCPDAIASAPAEEALVLAALGMPDNPGTEVWWVPSCEFWFAHDESPAPEMVWMGSFTYCAKARLVAGPVDPAPPVVPSWSENFDSYDLGSGLHGQGGWKGWDNDPVFDAFVTDAEANSAPHAVDVAVDSDVVREYEGHSSGRWAFAAWQYIPGDFQSGDETPFDPGTYFLLLNTYNDGGPYNWSVQYNFDSNDGMLKVCYGNGQDTIDVPYATDRWVKLEAIVDLDSDWTQVYYDDQLLAEYSWTGGIYGAGGGVLEIGAVDLFANGSTSVYYDNLSLRPVLP